MEAQIPSVPKTEPIIHATTIASEEEGQEPEEEEEEEKRPIAMPA